MPRFFFDLVDGETLIDDVGTVASDLPGARDEATRILGETVLDDFPGDGACRELLVIVRNEAGDVVLEVSLRYEVRPAIA